MTTAPCTTGWVDEFHFFTQSIVGRREVILTDRRSVALRKPSLSLSNTWNASRSSSSMCWWAVLVAVTGERATCSGLSDCSFTGTDEWWGWREPAAAAAAAAAVCSYLIINSWNSPKLIEPSPAQYYVITASPLSRDSRHLSSHHRDVRDYDYCDIC